ncbi:MAG: magnesium/cobalt transporter CorA [Nanoarchaeota archaeon]|nr:magnesium/cobalt transporter CorA [Nanoarchaeota archaeon]
MNIIPFAKHASKKAGMSPGSVVFVGKKKIAKPQFTLIDYTNKTFVQKKLKRVEDAFPFKNLPSVTWLDIIGLHETQVIEKIGKHFELHPLIQEDIVNTNQRPIFEDSDKYLFFVLKMMHIEKDDVVAEQVSIVVGPNFVISFQEREGDVFDPIRERIEKGRYVIRERESDYLTYALIDSIVDHYFLVLEKIGDTIESIEEELNQDPSPAIVAAIHKLKRELIFLRKSVWPLREVVSKFQKCESKIVKKQTHKYIGDVYDHIVQVIDTIESYKDTTSGMMDMYLSTVSNKMNEIMKVLTIFAAIFIPLTFLAGIYGMNFEYIPELSWPFGYFFAWILFGLIGGGMLLFFRKKKWI